MGFTEKGSLHMSPMGEGVSLLAAPSLPRRVLGVRLPLAISLIYAASRSPETGGRFITNTKPPDRVPCSSGGTTPTHRRC